jgi:cysteine desulfurase
MSTRVYLDHNASMPLLPEARDALSAALELDGNPSSVHAEGRRIRTVVEDAREKVAALVGAEPRHVIFTSGGTESNVTSLSPWNVNRDAPDSVVCFMPGIEHPSVLAGGRFAPRAIRTVDVTTDGVIDVDALEREIAAFRDQAGEGSFMVSLMLANNETGAIQPVAAVGEIVRERGGILHCDAVQAAGRVRVDIRDLGAHMLSISAHKIGGPKGVGALVLGGAMTSLPKPLIVGGGQEFRARSGTENVAGIAGFGAAAACAVRNAERMAAVAVLRDRLEAAVSARASDAVFFARDGERLPNTSNFAVPFMKAETLVIALDLAGIAVSAGSACSSGKVEQSHVLDAMGVGPDTARGAIRVSLGCGTTEKDIDAFIGAWGAIYDQFTTERAAA